LHLATSIDDRSHTCGEIVESLVVIGVEEDHPAYSPIDRGKRHQCVFDRRCCGLFRNAIGEARFFNDHAANVYRHADTGHQIAHGPDRRLDAVARQNLVAQHGSSGHLEQCRAIAADHPVSATDLVKRVLGDRQRPAGRNRNRDIELAEPLQCAMGVGADVAVPINQRSINVEYNQLRNAHLAERTVRRSTDSAGDTMSKRLDGKVAVIVGGASGFGLATSELFAEHGAQVVIAQRRSALASEVADRLGGTGVACDITDFEQLEAVTAGVMDQHGRIDIAVNYAGYEKSTPIRDLTPAILEPMVQVQLNGAIYFIRAMANAMSENPDGAGGSIISTSSLTAQNPGKGLAAYAASKAGLEYVTQIAALEYGPDNVRVNCIAAHLIETPMTAGHFKNRLAIQAIENQTPLGRMGHVDDIANAALFLASSESGYISGETLRVDGGAFTQKLPTALDYELLANARPDLL